MLVLATAEMLTITNQALVDSTHPRKDSMAQMNPVITIHRHQETSPSFKAKTSKS